MLGVCLAVDGKREVKVWLDGAGAALMMGISPGIATLGLYAHTHKAMLQRHARSLAVLCVLICPTGLLFTAKLGALLGIKPADVAAIVPCTTTTGLAIAMGETMPSASQELVPLGPMICGFTSVVLWPAYLFVTGLRNARSFHRGLALGAVSHVAAMAALFGAGETAAAEAAALAFFLLGTFRCLLVKFEPFNQLLLATCGFEPRPREPEKREEEEDEGERSR